MLNRGKLLSLSYLLVVFDLLVLHLHLTELLDQGICGCIWRLQDAASQLELLAILLRRG